MSYQSLWSLFCCSCSVMLCFACGGSSSSSDSGSGTETASVESLSDLPSLDLSNYDYSDQSSSASLSVKSLSTSSKKSVTKAAVAGGGIGGASPAFCHSKTQKDEAIRMSQQIQMDRCYIEAMEAAGLIEIPVGSYAYYKVSVPENFDDDFEEQQQGGSEQAGGEQQGQEQGGPPPQSVSKAGEDGPPEGEFRSCDNEEGKNGHNMLIRVGRGIDSESESSLHIDMCEGASGSEELINEATYAADADTYTVNTTRIAEFCGVQESGNFNVSFSGISEVDSSGIAQLSSDGTLSARGCFDGAFGSGCISLEANQASQSNIVSGSFNGSHQSPEGTFEFTDTNYSRFGGLSNTGTTKFEFSGSFPPMRVSQMCGGFFGEEQGVNDGCLEHISQEIGQTVTSQNAEDTYVCPGPDGMEPVADDGSCTQTGSGLESFSIAEDGSSAVTIFDYQSAYYFGVNAINLDDISGDVDDIAFSRNWNCSAEGSFTELDMEEVFSGEGAALAQAKLEVCMALESTLREAEGMGGFNCQQQEEANKIAGDLEDEGEQLANVEGHEGNIPEPCIGLSPEECREICDADPDSCFGDAEGPKGFFPQACIDAGLDDPEQCGNFCAENPC